MNRRYRSLLILGSFVVCGIGAVAAWFTTGEILVAWYMASHNIGSRAELSEDMGFGMLAFALDILAIPLFVTVFSILWWRMAKRVLWGDGDRRQ